MKTQSALTPSLGALLASIIALGEVVALWPSYANAEDPASGHITGTVTDQAGDPLEGVRASFYADCAPAVAPDFCGDQV
jgi:hypothetical protein